MRLQSRKTKTTSSKSKSKSAQKNHTPQKKSNASSQILALQKQLGNQTVQRLLTTETETHPAASTPNDHIQKKDKQYDPAENLTAARFSGIPELEQAYDNQTLIFDGRAGTFVTAIQKALEDFGFPLKEFGPDGIYGAETKQAVIDFQTAAGAEMIDGIIGPETMRLLDARANRDSEEKKEERRQETIEETRETIIEKVKKAIEEGGDDLRPQYSLCVLDQYTQYLSGNSTVKDTFMSDLAVFYYIEQNLGVEGAPHFEHPDDRRAPHAFKLLDRYVDRSPEILTREIVSLTKRVLAGFHMLNTQSKKPYYAMSRKHTIEFLQRYFAERIADPNDIHHCFQ